MYGDRKIVKFRITDGRYSHKVSVWGKLAVKTDEEYQKIEDKLVVVIVTSTKLKIFKNSVQISTLPSSKVYLNLDDEVVTAMKNRLEEEGYKAPKNYLASPLPSLSHRVIETITLKELSEKTSTDDLNLEGTGEYPPNIKNIVGKELTFRIEISSDNVLLHSRIFNVIDAYDNEYLASSPSNASIGAVAISCFSENTIDLSNCDDTPGSVNSISKKPKMVMQ
ncbi:hypothetical protein POM88_042040 [Heracleum sosnowskyi]|uniref:Uncharacterized protein n=1 Tax=Heracleum sosnowskyi TaxID=360622 RepID=A0AAD8HHI3_9APIA|nr:hypothetical protein POM88_042040 [Heracleum sosnowskyi]